MHVAIVYGNDDNNKSLWTFSLLVEEMQNLIQDPSRVEVDAVQVFCWKRFQEMIEVIYVFRGYKTSFIDALES